MFKRLLSLLATSLFALYVMAACSGGSTEVPPDQGVQKDTGGKADWAADWWPYKDGKAQNDGPVTQKDGPVTQNDGPVTQNDGPVTQQDGPVTQQDGPVTPPDGPQPPPDGPPPPPDLLQPADMTPDQPYTPPSASQSPWKFQMGWRIP